MKLDIWNYLDPNPRVIAAVSFAEKEFLSSSFIINTVTDEITKEDIDIIYCVSILFDALVERGAYGADLAGSLTIYNKTAWKENQRQPEIAKDFLVGDRVRLWNSDIETFIILRFADEKCCEIQDVANGVTEEVLYTHLSKFVY